LVAGAGRMGESLPRVPDRRGEEKTELYTGGTGRKDRPEERRGELRIFKRQKGEKKIDTEGERKRGWSVPH